MKIFYTNPHINSLILVSGDRDYIPLVIELRQMGKHVTVLGVGQSLSSDLAEVADEFVLYEDIVEDLAAKEGVTVTERVELSSDPYSILVEEVKAARRKGQATVLPYLKLRLKDRIAGFDETKLPEKTGGPFNKFKDFIMEGVHKGFVKIYTTATANEVFLPDEDPAEISHFKDIKHNTENREEDTSTGDFEIPPEDITEMIADVLEKNDGPLPYVDIVKGLMKSKQKGEFFLSPDDIKYYVKSCIHYEILSGYKEGKITWYEMTESWRDIRSQLEENST